MIRHIKVTHAEGAHYDGTTHPTGAIVPMPGDVADRFVAAGKGDLLPAGSNLADAAVLRNPLIDAVDPLVPNADPTHAARMGSVQIEQHPGLLALNDAGHPEVPRRAGRLAPGALPDSDAVLPANNPPPPLVVPDASGDSTVKTAVALDAALTPKAAAKVK